LPPPLSRRGGRGCVRDVLWVVSSNALKNFVDRLQEVQQLLDAHTALVQLKKAQALANSGTGMSQVLGVIQALVSAPGKGRPPEVQALNAGAIALLSAHLQGFVTDLFQEAARHLLTGHVPDVDALLDAANTRGNPNENNIRRLFASIGFSDVLLGVSWQKVGNKAVRTKLRSFNELRNRIVHGKSEKVHKKQVAIYMSVWRNFAGKLDDRVGSEIVKKTGKAPW